MITAVVVSPLSDLLDASVSVEQAESINKSKRMNGGGEASKQRRDRTLALAKKCLPFALHASDPTTG